MCSQQQENMQNIQARVDVWIEQQEAGHSTIDSVLLFIYMMTTLLQASGHIYYLSM